MVHRAHLAVCGVWARHTVSANPSVTVMCLPFLSPEECTAIVEALTASDWSAGAIALPTDEASPEAKTIRSCDVNSSVAQDLQERLGVALRALNAGMYRFELSSGWHAQDPVTAMRYRVGDHFDWHMDNAALVPPFNTRKLSVSVQLTDAERYEGGDLEFAMTELADYGRQAATQQRQAARQQGAMVVFPSFMMHRVSPVTAGERHALVGWLHGPAFR